MNKNKLIKEFTEAVEEMRQSHGYGTYYWLIGEDEENYCELVDGRIVSLMY